MKKITIYMLKLGIFSLIAGGAHGQTFDIQSVTASDSHRNFPASNVIDGDLDRNSRWAGSGSRNPERIILDLGTIRRVDDIQIAWTGSIRYPFRVQGRSGTGGSWTNLFTGQSSGNGDNFENYNLQDFDARQVRVIGDRDGFTNITEVTISGTAGPSGSPSPSPSPSPTPTPTPSPSPSPSGSPEAAEFSGFGLNPNRQPWENFDLDDWALDSPEARDSDECRSRRVDEDEWDEVPGTDTADYIFTHTDGGMRFVSPVGGATTNSSCNSGFPRSELREMLRRGNTSVSTTGVNANNWRLGYQPGNNTNHGGRNGTLRATLVVNRVTTTGDGLHPGRTIIGQIHASDDEPARLYYRKLPNADRGCIYLEHEIRNGSDRTFNMIGNEQCTGNGPSNGIALGELFSYEIENDDEDIIVRVYRGDGASLLDQVTIDMDNEDSGYDRSDEWMYFKAGAYTQNNTGNDNDEDIITFYRLNNLHDNN